MMYHEVMESGRAMAILLHLYENGACGMTSVRREVTNGHHLERTLGRLEEAGLITIYHRTGSNRVDLCLTWRGRRVSEILERIEGVLEGVG